jgi:hypothetical protein
MTCSTGSPNSVRETDHLGVIPWASGRAGQFCDGVFGCRAGNPARS